MPKEIRFDPVYDGRQVFFFFLHKVVHVKSRVSIGIVPNITLNRIPVHAILTHTYLIYFERSPLQNSIEYLSISLSVRIKLNYLRLNSDGYRLYIFTSINGNILKRYIIVFELRMICFPQANYSYQRHDIRIIYIYYTHT